MTDFQKTHSVIINLRDQFIALKPTDKPAGFIDYCQQVIKLAEGGTLSHREAGYAIADLMFDKTVSSEPGLEAITLLAGNIELPDDVISGDPDKEWDKLKKWVDEARKKYR